MSGEALEENRDPYLISIGDGIRRLRSRRGLTRKALARLADVSERHLASIEAGQANATIQFLRQLAQVLNCTLAEIIGDETAVSPEWLMIREILHGKSEKELAQARVTLGEVLGPPGGTEQARLQRVALIGMRGAGKSSLGRMLADYWMVPFVELRQHVELLAGCEVAEIHALYGANAYQRYESRALEYVLSRYPQAVIATPGEIYTEAGTFKRLLSNCYTVWLTASPKDHLERVLVQGEGRTILSLEEAVTNLQEALKSRESYYSQADTSFDTSEMAQEAAFFGLLDHLRGKIRHS